MPGYVIHRIRKGNGMVAGKFTTFSKQSRTRLFDLFHRMEIKRKAVFLTLTYGEDYPDAKTAKTTCEPFWKEFGAKWQVYRLAPFGAWNSRSEERRTFTLSF